jgi:LacI family transcriptional regulator
MKTVAAKAGVSVMTVSRALRNEQRVAPDTRSRILQVAEEVGYRPNPLVGALMAGIRRTRTRGASTQTIAFLTSHPSASGWREHKAPAAFYAGGQHRAEQLGFRLEPIWAREPGVAGSRLSRILRTRGISGVIIAPYPVPSSGTIELDWDCFAAIALGYSLREPRIHRVTNHHLDSMRIAIAELTRRGYRRLGLAMASGHNERIQHNWATGFMYYQSRLPASDQVPVFMPPEPRREAFDQWREEHQPDVILGTVGLPWIRAADVAIPRDLGFVSLDYYPSLGDVAGIVQNNHAVGAAAVDLVVEQLYHNERGVPEIPKIVMMEGRWRDGATVRPAETATSARRA